MRPAPLAFAAALLLAAARGPGQEAGRPQDSVTVEPRVIVAGMLYDGARVHVRADVPADAAVAILCQGDEGPLRLRKKGKALGLFWMNVGDVSWEVVPEVYLLRSSSALDRLAPAAELERLGIGPAALRARARPGPGADALFGELARLKENDGLWVLAAGGVELRPGRDGAIALADLPVPVKAPPGSYQVRVYAFADGRGELVGRAGFEVTQGGVPAFIASLAAEHGLLYGVLAVLVAVAVGLLTGVVFGLGSRKGH
jgi:uncharacterized protein (TIGR02186 family)